MRKLLLLLFLSSICSLFSQEKYFFSPLSLENGLSQIGVTSIHQDKYNLMWFGTRNGLNKYDGYTFNAFLHNPNDSLSISDNHILCIEDDNYGYLWIGTNRGLNRYDATTNSFQNYFASPDDTSISSNTIRAIYFDSDNNLWIGTTSGLNRYNYDTDTFEQYFLDKLLNNNAINALAEYDGKLYIGTIKKGLTDSMNADRLIQFMQQLIKSSSCKVFLILDNLKVHHSNLVKQWVEQHKEEIELFFLPSYSPERNPDEYLNCDLKQGLSVKPSPKNQGKLKSNMEDHMNLLCQSPERVMKYFKHDSIKYAS